MSGLSPKCENGDDISDDSETVGYTVVVVVGFTYEADGQHQHELHTTVAEKGQKSVMPTMTGVQHFSLTVRDLEVSIPWYEQVLGLTKVHDVQQEGSHVVGLMDPQSMLYISLRAHDLNRGEIFSETHTGLDHISFGVSTRAELEDWLARFEELGVTHSPIADVPYGSVLVFRDPDNIQLELITPPAL
jgi:glyoxylase I family protein